MAPLPAHASTRWQGPLRIAIAIFLAGLLVVWLIKPIGDACPDLGALPSGSTASSSPSFSPPLTRTCTYLAAGGTRATARYVPWLDVLVLVLVAGAVAGVAAVISPAARGGAGPSRAPRRQREPPPIASAGERDADERERARRERAERNRSRRGG
ncbi:MAG: hypothetical protein WKF48_02580 [Solirubrobacteraceae bacterium]